MSQTLIWVLSKTHDQPDLDDEREREKVTCKNLPSENVKKKQQIRRERRVGPRLTIHKQHTQRERKRGGKVRSCEINLVENSFIAYTHSSFVSLSFIPLLPSPLCVETSKHNKTCSFFSFSFLRDSFPFHSERALRPNLTCFVPHSFTSSSSSSSPRRRVTIRPAIYSNKKQQFTHRRGEKKNVSIKKNRKQGKRRSELRESKKILCFLHFSLLIFIVEAARRELCVLHVTRLLHDVREGILAYFPQSQRHLIHQTILTFRISAHIAARNRSPLSLSSWLMSSTMLWKVANFFLHIHLPVGEITNANTLERRSCVVHINSHSPHFTINVNLNISLTYSFFILPRPSTHG